VRWDAEIESVGHCIFESFLLPCPGPALLLLLWREIELWNKACRHCPYQAGEDERSLSCCSNQNQGMGPCHARPAGGNKGKRHSLSLPLPAAFFEHYQARFDPDTNATTRRVFST